MSEVLDILELFALATGVGFCLLAAIGVVRMPDVYTRMQASTKAGTLGIALIVASVGLHFRDAVTMLHSGLVIGFLFLTAPVASHLIARAAYVLGSASWRGSVIDEMAGHEDREATDAATASRPGADAPDPRDASSREA